MPNAKEVKSSGKPGRPERFKAFLIQQSEHFLTVLRYVERNAHRAEFDKFAEDWPWESLRCRTASDGSELLSPPPVQPPKTWARLTIEPQSEVEVAAMRRGIERGRSFGSETWT